MGSEDGSEDGLPRVSVVLPTYGRAEQLSRAIESVASQTYTDIELIVVDDGSPEPVAETITDEEVGSIETVTFIRHRENRGANVARNSGIRAATGDYIAFLDDDDEWAETKVSKQVRRFLSAGSDVGVVYTGKRTHSVRGTSEFVPAAEGDVMEDLLRGANFGQFSSVMVAADVIEEAGLPDERFPAWQDREWFFRLAKHCEFSYVAEPLTIRHTASADRIGTQFEKKRDVAYPLFIDKHYSQAREYGIYDARTFVATLRTDIGLSAVWAGEYTKGRTQFVSAVLANPFYRPVYKYLLASLGGKWSYKPIAHLREKVASYLNVVSES